MADKIDNRRQKEQPPSLEKLVWNGLSGSIEKQRKLLNCVRGADIELIIRGFPPACAVEELTALGAKVNYFDINYAMGTLTVEYAKASIGGTVFTNRVIDKVNELLSNGWEWNDRR